MVVSSELVRLQLAEDGQTKKWAMQHTFLAPSMREVEAILPSNMFRNEPVDEVWRGVCYLHYQK